MDTHGKWWTELLIFVARNELDGQGCWSGVELTFELVLSIFYACLVPRRHRNALACPTHIVINREIGNIMVRDACLSCSKPKQSR
jgi:hypothetical protein